jgi:hypothetical protein
MGVWRDEDGVRRMRYVSANDKKRPLGGCRAQSWNPRHLNLRSAGVEADEMKSSEEGKAAGSLDEWSGRGKDLALP